jgi:hypothetical protein
LKFFVDMPVTPQAVAHLEANGHDAIHASAVGLAGKAGIEILGELPDYHTSTGYRVRPVVGWIEPPVDFAPDPYEVADVFEVPLAFLLETANHRYECAFYRGRLRHYWAMPWRGRCLWGATAGMLVTFQRIVETRRGE